MKLPIDTNFVIQVAAQTDIELKEASQRSAGGRRHSPLPMRLSIAEVEAVLTALHVLGHYTPPHGAGLGLGRCHYRVCQ